MMFQNKVVWMIAIGLASNSIISIQGDSEEDRELERRKTEREEGSSILHDNGCASLEFCWNEMRTRNC